MTHVHRHACPVHGHTYTCPYFSQLMINYLILGPQFEKIWKSEACVHLFSLKNKISYISKSLLQRTINISDTCK